MEALKSRAKDVYHNEPSSLDLEMYRQYSGVGDFEKMGRSHTFLKVLMVGDIGLGKSALCSKLVGIHLVKRGRQDEDTGHGALRWVGREDCKFSETPFRSGRTKDSVTKETSFVLSHYLGDSNSQNIMVIDSPGFFDPESVSKSDITREECEQYNYDFMTDLRDKLRAVREIHAILILMNLGNGGRFTYTLLKTIQAISSMFERQSASLSQHLVFVYSKCDKEDEDEIEHYIEQKQKQEEFQDIHRCLLEKGVTLTPLDRPHLFYLSSKNPNPRDISSLQEFKNMYRLLLSSPQLPTHQIQSPREYLESSSLYLYHYIYVYVYMYIFDYCRISLNNDTSFRFGDCAILTHPCWVHVCSTYFGVYNYNEVPLLDIIILLYLCIFLYFYWISEQCAIYIFYSIL